MRDAGRAYLPLRATVSSAPPYSTGAREQETLRDDWRTWLPWLYCALILPAFVVAFGSVFVAAGFANSSNLDRGGERSCRSLHFRSVLSRGIVRKALLTSEESPAYKYTRTCTVSHDRVFIDTLYATTSCCPFVCVCISIMPILVQQIN